MIFEFMIKSYSVSVYIIIEGEPLDLLNKNINMLSLLVTYTLRWSCLLLKPRISRNIIITGLNNYRVFGVKNPARNTLEEGDIYIFHHHKLGPK